MSSTSGDAADDRRLTFIDTNVLVYAHDSQDLRKHELASALLDDLWADMTGVLSAQVLQEFYAVATRKFHPTMPYADAREVVALYADWQTVSADVSLMLAASLLQEEHGFSFWDALIIEAARRAGAARLMTEDLQAGREIGGVRILNPFA